MLKTTTVGTRVEEVDGGSNALWGEDLSNLTKSRKNRSDLTKSKNPTKSDYIAGGSDFLTPNASAAFTQLRQAFTEAPTLRHFEPDYYIRIETDASGYTIGGVLSQLITETGKWHPVAYFSRKMIPAETW